MVADFARWAAGERVSDAARQRSRERWLRQQAVESATLTGVLTDLAERATPLALATRTRHLTGHIAGVAEDFLVVEERNGAVLLVVTAHLATVAPLPTTGAGWDPRSDRGTRARWGFEHEDSWPVPTYAAGPALPTGPGRAPTPDPSGDRPAPIPLSFVDALVLLGADRSPVQLAVISGEVLSGDLVAVGTDLVTLQGAPVDRGNGPGRGQHIQVPLTAIEVCTPR